MSKVEFKVNGRCCSVGCEVSSRMKLVDYIRYFLELRGTKYMCREGGCGVCIVGVTKRPGGPVLAVNSCLVLIVACHGWEITTIEGLGNRKKGYHPLQKTLAKFNGTQCGHCSPGFVMSMYSTIQTNTNLTMLDIEQSFGSNVCRCTGYRPILDAYKTFAKDCPTAIKDIEELDRKCNKTDRKCARSDSIGEDWCFINKNEINNEVIRIKLKDNKIWYKVYTVDEIFQIFKNENIEDYMLIGGDTAKGVKPIDEYPRLLIDVNSVLELQKHILDQNLIIGSGTTITELIQIFDEVSSDDEFVYLKVLNGHLKNVAHPAVRNVATIAGNLVLKHEYREFASDIYMLLETVGAFITLRKFNKQEVVSMEQFLAKDIKGYIIINVILPPLRKDYKIFTIKVSPRSQNSHAVSAGFLYKLTPNNTVLESRIVYAGLSSTFNRAKATETCLFGKNLFRNETLQQAFTVLGKELIVEAISGETSVEYRRELAPALFYKSILNLCPTSKVNPRYKSGAIKIHTTRPVSQARQIYDTNYALWPLTKRLPKVEALIQCAGEAKYTEDLPKLPDEVFAAFCLTTVALGDIVSIDPSDAMKYPGTIAFYTAKDIPGVNTFIPIQPPFYVKDEEVLCSGAVKYYSQPYAIIVAETQQIADVAAKMVKVEYKNVLKPVINVEEAIKDPKRVKLFFHADANEKGDDLFKVIKGQDTIRGSYHFCLETVVTVTVPTEDGLKVYASTHWLDGVQNVVSRALKLDANRIDVYVSRVGGSFGLKSTRTNRLAVASCLVAYKLNRPCRFIHSLIANTKSFGKRTPSTRTYEAAVNSSGVIQHVTCNLYEDSGYISSEALILGGIDAYNNCYDKSRWDFKSYECITDNAKHSWFRAPSSFEHIGMAELLMDHIAYELNIDPIDVRLANIDYNNYKNIVDMIKEVKHRSDYDDRRRAVDQYNKNNRWIKKGIRFSLLRWTSSIVANAVVTLTVFHTDGTVAITHGCVELGQGINTKAIQICAHILNIDINKIVIKANDTMIAPNGFGTVASVSSQNVGFGILKCCEELQRRLEPVRNKLGNPEWSELIKAAYADNIDLQTHYSVTPDDFVQTTVLGVALAEVQVDMLTGQSEVVRVDLMEDVGQSVNPDIDLGQVEGAFIQGQGAWTSEALKYNPDTGELLTDRTWNYFVPQARDIPQVFNVYFRKKSYSKAAIMGSKCVGEPPICLSVVVALAITEAVASARGDAGVNPINVFPRGPFTIERIFLNAENNTEDYKIY